MKVENMISNRGNKVANQFIIWGENEVTFQSYSSIICNITNDTITFGQDWDYSRTTTKYLYQFLRDRGLDVTNKKDVEYMIKEGNTSSRWNDYIVVYNEKL